MVHCNRQTDAYAVTAGQMSTLSLLTDAYTVTAGQMRALSLPDALSKL